jgi:hypothetical protein
MPEPEPISSLGALCLSVERFKTLLAAQTVFQTFVGANNATNALPFIYEYLAPADTARPFAIVSISTEASFAGVLTGERGPVATAVAIRLILEADQVENDVTSQVRAFYNVIGQLLPTLLTASRSNTTLEVPFLTGFETVELGWMDAGKDRSATPYFFGEFEFTAGLGGGQ